MRHTSLSQSTLPFLLAGPILRKTTTNEINVWIVTSKPFTGCMSLYAEDKTLDSAAKVGIQSLQVGTHAWVSLISAEGTFPKDTSLEYSLAQEGEGDLAQWAPHLFYNDNQRVSFRISAKADYILHGSCRNPHHSSKDSLVAADDKVSNQELFDRPDLLMMSGDQIYADHVAGPTLDAIDQVIELLGLASESFPIDSHNSQDESANNNLQSVIRNSDELYKSELNFYHRDKILPHYVKSDSLIDKLFPKRRLPIFSSTESENHLITLSEFIAMYLLVWSPTLWALVNTERLRDKGFTHSGNTLSPAIQQLWRDEKEHIDAFVAGLPQVQRLMAHIPTYMIFDDHDVTDDWNLTVGWEQAANQNPFASQVIGNGLYAYWLCQGWGNEPENFSSEFLDHARSIFETKPDNNGTQTLAIDLAKQTDCLRNLNNFEKWHYTIHSSPKVVVLDTRTRRWRSESRMNKPSGLMDWEALIEFQHELIDQDKVIIVSAAPMFGVKFIETLQKSMTTLGQPLVIDAENWMAHPGSANTLISIFTHTKTPTNFVILSGDVHYSFAYDIKLRYRKNSPNIYQITCSGIKNQFPAPLLKFCDISDRLLYSPHSPLNWFTKRKRLKIEKRSPDNQRFYRLVNQSAIGELRLDEAGKPEVISILTGKGDIVHFPEHD
ncbi:alkaline phosphatase family protein [Vibrio makurazakiensis]|uniref:alkaline phosphatase D family protein n=1 Tax=Vibrio makurazakiensis TaxID=2910250 RepID=UPI003D0C14CD